MSSGLSVIDIGEVPTPLLYFSLFHYNIGNGVVITASHNPKEFNGFKICRNKTTIYGTEIQKIKHIIEKGKFASGKGDIEQLDVIPTYIDYVVDRVKIQPGLKIIIDTGNGTCGPIIDQIMTRIGSSYEILFKEPDGNFPNHLADPTVKEHIATLIDKVKNNETCCLQYMPKMF
jgi:phosphomannomutase/phosphoglucomutase